MAGHFIRGQFDLRTTAHRSGRVPAAGTHDHAPLGDLPPAASDELRRISTVDVQEHTTHRPEGCVILLANSYEAAASVRDAAAAGRRFPRESHCLVLRQWREGHSGTCLRRTIVGAVASNRYRALSGRIARATDDRRGRVTAADHRADTCLPVDQVRAGLRRGQTAKRSPVRQTAAGQRATIIRLGCVMPYAS